MISILNSTTIRLAIAGFGYVGLLLVVEFDKKCPVTGFDIKQGRPEPRNTNVIDIVRELTNYHAWVDIFESWIDGAEAAYEYKVTLFADKPQPNNYDAIVLALVHSEFLQMGATGIHAFGKPEYVLYGLKSLRGKAESDGRL